MNEYIIGHATLKDVLTICIGSLIVLILLAKMWYHHKHFYEICAKKALMEENFTDDPNDYKIKTVIVNGKIIYEPWGRTNHGNWYRIAEGWSDIGEYLPNAYKTESEAQREIDNCINQRAGMIYLMKRDLYEAQLRND